MIATSFVVQPAVSWDTPPAGYFLEALGTNTLRVSGWDGMFLRSTDITISPAGSSMPRTGTTLPVMASVTCPNSNAPMSMHAAQEITVQQA
ncbi:MAG: hypothetical protein U1E76_18600 [Planctomycetota bacterium]